MKSRLVRLGAVALTILTLASCGGDGGGDGGSTPPPPPGSLAATIQKAAADPANDTSTNSSSAFSVLQDAGVPAVVVNSPPKVNFTVFSDGAVVKSLTTSNARFAIAKLIPGTDGNPDQWVNYVYRTETATPGVGPGGNPVLPSALQATTDPATSAQLVFNADGYYTYTFSTDITDPTKTNGVIFEPGRTHRVAIQLSYTNAAGETVNVNPYYDVTFDSSGNSVAVTDPSKTRKMADVSSCNSCHEKLALHGGGRVDVQYCVLCHNPGTTDANSGNVLAMSTMIHKIHAGRLLKTKLDEGEGGEEYVIWGYRDSEHNYSEVGFPQDLRNCTKCHTAENPSTPQGDNWKTESSKQACLTCHANNAGSDWDATHLTLAKVLVGPDANAKDLTDAMCKDCHRPGSNVAPERVHWNQNEENAAKYKFNIEDIVVLQAPTDTLEGAVQVKYSLTDPTNDDAAYQLEGDARFNNLRLYIAYQNVVGQPATVTEFSSYNNGGSGARVNANAGVNDGSNHYTAVIQIPRNTATAVAQGTARVITYGAVAEIKLEVKSASDPRPPATPLETVNVLVQNSAKDFALTGTLNPRRTVVSNDKCNACHGALGATSGSNTLINAFHGGSRNIVESCVMCHDANRAGSSIMTSGTAMIESYQFKRMIHGIHGNSKRTYPFTHGNRVAGAFGKDGVLLTDGLAALVSSTSSSNPVSAPPGTEYEPWLVPSPVIPAGTPFASGVENYAAEVAWPGVGINCSVCHVDGSFKQDLGTLGAAVKKPILAATSKADPNVSNWLVISPKAATCTACHDSSYAIGHVASYGGAAYGNLSQAQYLAGPTETCNDCHAPGYFLGVDVVHGQQ